MVWCYERMIKKNGIDFQIEGYPMCVLNGETYRVTNGEETVWAYAPMDMSIDEVLETAEQQFGEGVSVHND